MDPRLRGGDNTGDFHLFGWAAGPWTLGVNWANGLSMTRRGAQEGSEGALSGTVREGQQDIGALVWHAIILSGAKNLVLEFSVEKRQGEMLRGVYPEPIRFAQGKLRERAQRDSEGALSRTS
ncbi:MAG: hypothetical protein ABSE93_26120 [Terriglobia bacterium]